MRKKRQKNYTWKQRLWLRDFLISGDKKHATEAAGYKLNRFGRCHSEQTKNNIGRKNFELMKDKIIKAIELGTTKWLTKEYVLNRLKVLSERKGIKESSEIQALELMGKSMGLFADRVITEDARILEYKKVTLLGGFAETPEGISEPKTVQIEEGRASPATPSFKGVIELKKDESTPP